MRIMNELIALCANKNGFMNLFLPLLSSFLSTLKNDSSRNFELLDNDYFLSPSVSNQWSSKENSQVNQYDQKIKTSLEDASTFSDFPIAIKWCKQRRQSDNM